MSVHRIILRGASLQAVRDFIKLRNALEAEQQRLQRVINQAGKETVAQCVRNNGQSLSGSWGIDSQYLEIHGLAFLNGEVFIEEGDRDEDAHDAGSSGTGIQLKPN